MGKSAIWTRGSTTCRRQPRGSTRARTAIFSCDPRWVFQARVALLDPTDRYSRLKELSGTNKKNCQMALLEVLKTDKKRRPKKGKVNISYIFWYLFNGNMKIVFFFVFFALCPNGFSPASLQKSKYCPTQPDGKLSKSGPSESCESCVPIYFPNLTLTTYSCTPPPFTHTHAWLSE